MLERAGSRRAPWYAGLVVMAIGLVSACQSSPPMVASYRAAVSLEGAGFSSCIASLPAPPAGPRGTPLLDAELMAAEDALASTRALLAVFDAPATSEGSGAAFGPTMYEGLAITGHARATDAGVAFSVTLADGAAILEGTRREGVLELVVDRRAAGGRIGDGRAALRFEVREALPWRSTAVVLAEWSTGGASPRSTRATCSRSEAEDALHFVTATLARDVDGDGLEDRGTFAAIRRRGEGGRLFFTGQAGSRPGRAQQSLSECWAEDGSLTFTLASDGTTTVTVPEGATDALCAPWNAPLDVPDLSPVYLSALAELAARAYDDLHRPLEFEARPHRVLWVGAHPDDEGYYGAPLLGHLCRDLGGDCTLLVATNGSTGSCRVPTGCPPDLGTWREGEMLAAGDALGGTVEQWRWPPGEYPGDPTMDLSRWATAAGSEAALVEAIGAVLDRVNPEIVVTLDPDHGASCHAEHRVVSRLLLAALDARGSTARVLFNEGVGLPPFVQDEDLLAYDASEPATTGEDTWGYLLLDLMAHRSQATPEEVAAFAATEARSRRLYFLDRADRAEGDPRYQRCPNR